MRKLLIGLLLLPFVGAGQVVDFGKIPTRDEVKQMIKDAQFGNVKPPVVVLPACDCGLKLVSLIEAKAASVKFNFYGCGDIKDISYYVIQGPDTLRNGNVVPVNDKPIVTFTELAPGDYKFVIRGRSCASSLSEVKSFTVPKLTGEVTPPVVIPPIVQPGTPSELVPKNIAKGHPDNANFQFTRVFGGWSITDIAPRGPDSDYQFWYFINGQIIKTDAPLKDYLYLSNAPIRILKMQGRNGLDTFNRWHPSNLNDGYYKANAGSSLKYNTSAAYYTGTFTVENGYFFNPIPSAYNPETKITQWADVVEPFKLPAGHFLVLGRGEWTVKEIFDKGQTHLSVFEFPSDGSGNEPNLTKEGKTYSGVQRPEAFFGLNAQQPNEEWVNGYNKQFWPNGQLSKEYVENKARTGQVYAITINETEEGRTATPKDWDMWGHYYKAYRAEQIEKFDKRGTPSYLAHNYYTLGLPDLLNKGMVSPDIETQRASAKAESRNPAGLDAYRFWTRGSLKDNNLISIGMYLGAPDLNIAILYDNIYKQINNSAIGIYSCVFIEAQSEWRPNNPQEIVFSDGKYYQADGFPLDPNVVIGASFTSHLFGGIGVIEWGGGSKDTQNKKTTVAYRGGLWFPDGWTTPAGEYLDGKWKSFGGPQFPHGTFGNDYFSPYKAGIDMVAFGSRMYAETFGKVYGGETSYLKFRIDEGKWITPSQEATDEIADAFFDKRGFCYSQVKDGKTAFFYLNAFTDNLSHKLEVVLPNGQMVTETVSSNAIHAKLL